MVRLGLPAPRSGAAGRGPAFGRPDAHGAGRGWGTLDELAEILTWKQLGLVTQPVGILNVNSFYDSLHQQMEKMASEGFLDSNYLAEVKISENPAKLLTLLGVKY